MKKIIFLLSLLCCSSIGYAHKASDSYLTLAASNTGLVSARWDIALRDLDVLLGLYPSPLKVLEKADEIRY